MNENALRLTRRLNLVLCFMILYVYQAYGQYDYNATGLPVCYVQLSKNIDSLTKTNYTDATMRIEQNGTVLLPDTFISIRLRGNATLSYEKKPYKIKFRKKTSLFGMPKNKTFVLLANYTDKSLMRTSIGLEVGKIIEFGWVPRSVFVELVVNGHYLGNYQLAENIKKSDGRVEISDTGFLIEFDFKYASSLHYFITDINKFPFTSKYPEDDEMIDSLFDYAHDQINQLESTLFGPLSSRDRSYATLIDEDSWARWYYWKNLLQMDECNRYYMKYDNTLQTKITMGPLWDFEWSLGAAQTNRPWGPFYMENKLFFKKIALDSVFMRRVAMLHLEYGKKVKEGVLHMYDVLIDSLQLSQELNFKRWPILSTPISLAKKPLGSWEAEVECDRQFFLNHFEWLDNYLLSYLPDSIISSSVKPVHVSSHSVKGVYSINGSSLKWPSRRNCLYIENGRKIISD